MAGPQLAADPRAAGLSSLAHFIVFHCADKIGTAQYYESIDLVDAFHPQTIIALFMNGQQLRSDTAPRSAYGSSASSATKAPNM